MTTDIEMTYLAKSQQAGKWGFTVPYTQAEGTSLLTFDLPAWMARPWTITLMGMKYSTGPLSSNVALHGTADQQSVSDCQVRIDWGVDSAMESALVDYPFAGCTFQVHAAVLRMYINFKSSLNANIPPMIGGFVSPFGSGRMAADLFGPTFTTNFGGLSPAQTRITNVPKRARAYRLVPRNIATLGGPSFQVTQGSGGPTGNIFPQIDYGTTGGGEQLAVADGGGSEHWYPYRSTFATLAPTTSIITVTNTGGIVAGDVNIVYLMDLG